MIDWYVLLIPLVLAPIALMFVFVGCDLETAGLAGPIVTTTRRVFLKYENIPTKTNPILEIAASYSFLPSVTMNWPSPSHVIQWNSDALVSGTVPEIGFVEFQAGENMPVNVTCVVTLVRSKSSPGASDYVPPITGLNATAEDQADNLTVFLLTYVESDPPDPGEYHKFELAPLD